MLHVLQGNNVTAEEAAESPSGELGIPSGAYHNGCKILLTFINHEFYY